jgi:hypothetical protein
MYENKQKKSLTGKSGSGSHNKSGKGDEMLGELEN